MHEKTLNSMIYEEKVLVKDNTKEVEMLRKKIEEIRK